jgi:hypothetical protein
MILQQDYLKVLVGDGCTFKVQVIYLEYELHYESAKCVLGTRNSISDS